jgi:hypothetical protein
MIMNDVKWRSLSDGDDPNFNENEDLLQSFPDNQVIILTDITFRFTLARYINVTNGYCEPCGEKVLRFAFVDEKA